MNVDEALRILLLYAMNKSSCGKLPEKEYNASLVLRKFIRDLKNANDEELKDIVNERL